MRDGKPRVGDVPGGQFAFDGGQAVGREGWQYLPACGAVGPWQFGLAEFGLVDAAVNVAEVGSEHGQVGGHGVAAFDVLEAQFAFAAVAEFGQVRRALPPGQPAVVGLGAVPGRCRVRTA